jgi:FtsP/CotA-like multicopper oxidase with cupredoxin domain
MLEDWIMKDGGGITGPRRRSSMGMMHGMMGRRNRFMGKGEFLLEPFYDGYAVNGRIYPALEPLAVEKGERVKLRLSNPSSATIYNLRLAGHTLTVTHADGRPLKPITVDVLRIGMGERYDVEFFANNPGYWMLAAQELGFGESRLRIPIKYKGVQNKEPSLPQFHRGLRFSSYWDLRANEESNRALVKRADIFIPQNLSGGMHSSFWTINGQVYPDAERLFIHENEQVRLSYLNHSMMHHPMHLHGHFFKFVNPRLTSTQWIAKDTIVVEPMERIDIEFNADNPGKWFHHCHNLYHMMAGMANEVVYQ